MNKIILWLIASLLSVFFSFLKAQTLGSRIVDSVTQKPIPYVTVQLKKKGVITNEEGRFNFLLDETIKETDSLHISCIGYASISKPLSTFTSNVIYLHPKAIELDPVVVTNKNYTAKEIIALVKDNMHKNYTTDLRKKKLFFRDSEHQDFSKANYTFVKSTIPELNKVFLDSVLRTLPKNSSYYTEVLCDLYGNQETGQQKIQLIKASELYDKSNLPDLTKLEEKFNEIIQSNIKRDSYLKIKSGLFGTKVDGEDFDEIFETEIDSTDAIALEKALEKKKKQEQELKTNFARYKRNSLAGMMQHLFYMEDSKINVINKSRKYEFDIQNFTYLGEDAVYIISFKPKGNADYKGTLYVNSEDFAVVRLDYENIKPLRKFKLLGFSMNNFMGKGKMIFSQQTGGTYGLRYLEEENGTRFGIRRPLKIIEKNRHVKGRNKQNELFLKLDAAITGIDKREVIVFDSEPLSRYNYDSFAESNTILPTYMPNYDPTFWEGHSIIEPNQAIREFTSQEVSAE